MGEGRIKYQCFRRLNILGTNNLEIFHMEISTNGFRSRSNSASRVPRVTQRTGKTRSVSGGRKAPQTPGVTLLVDFESENIRSEDEFTDSSKIKVYVRIRPFQSENRQNVRIFQKGNSVLVDQSGKTLNFACDTVFGESASQKEVYDDMAKSLLNRFTDGCNVCVFAYGQTGSGKTHSILGNEYEPGVLPQFCQDLFSMVAEDMEQQNVCIEVSFYELYLEKVYDLLSLTRNQLRIRGGDSAYLEGVTRVRVNDYVQLAAVLQAGLAKRATTATLVNEFSSRSHAIFQIVFRQNISEMVNGIEKKSVVLSNCYFVDLAGSERLDMSGYGNRAETVNINCSLLALQKVIDSKSGSNSTFVNYRESVLTRLLKECFGGNSVTSLLATVNPEFQFTGLSIGTLRFASKAALVRQTPKTNIDPFVTAVKDLKAQNDEMRAELEKLRLVAPSAMNDGRMSLFTNHETPCLIELFADASLNVWRKITDEETKYATAAADESPSIICFSRNGKCYVKVLSDWVILNGNFAVNGVEFELIHCDRLVLSGVRFFVFCAVLDGSKEGDEYIWKTPTFESVKLEYVEGTFSTVEEKLKEEARREFDEDREELIRQMNEELEKAQKELEELKQKMSKERRKSERAELSEIKLNLENCVSETSEIRRSLQKSSNDGVGELFTGFYDITNDERLELMQLQASISTANNILDNFKKRSTFAFKMIQNPLREVERISIRLMNLKARNFADLSFREFRHIFDELVDIYQNSAAIRDGVNDVESILYGGNWLWKKSVPGRRSNIFSTALYNSMCDVARSRRSSVGQIHRTLVSRKSTLSEAIDMAVNTKKAVAGTVLDTQLQLLRVNIEDDDESSPVGNRSLTNNLMRWTFELRVRLENANDHIHNCREENGRRIKGIASPEQLAIHAVMMFLLAVNTLETSIRCLDRNLTPLDTIITEMIQVVKLISKDRDRWIVAISAKSESASFFVKIMTKHLDMMYVLVGRLAFVSGETFPTSYIDNVEGGVGADLGSTSNAYLPEIKTKFNEGLMQGVDESCEGTMEICDAYRNGVSNTIYGHIVALLCEYIDAVQHTLLNRKPFDERIAFKIIRPLLFTRNLLMDPNTKLEKVVEQLVDLTTSLEKMSAENSVASELAHTLLPNIRRICSDILEAQKSTTNGEEILNTIYDDNGRSCAEIGAKCFPSRSTTPFINNEFEDDNDENYCDVFHGAK